MVPPARHGSRGVDAEMQASAVVGVVNAWERESRVLWSEHNKKGVSPMHNTPIGN